MTDALPLGPSVAAALPEILMAVGAMALLLSGVFRGDRSMRSIAYGSSVLMIAVAVLIAYRSGGEVVAFSGSFIVDRFSDFAKILVLIASALSLLVSLRYFAMERIARFEYPVIVVLATLGMMMMVSANDLMSLYVGLELQSLSLYVLAAFRRDETRSTEAGLKYFVLGALSSGLLLYGCSLIYGFAGTTGFAGIADVVAAGAPIGVIVGLVFLAAGLAFKISAVPFHMWTPDVYEGAPTPITAFFAAAPKLAAMALFVRVLMDPFIGIVGDWRQIVVFASAGSLILGAFAAIGQNNIKRLMAYSSIGHVGFALVGLAAGTAVGVRGVLIYMAIYIVMTLGTFVCILAMRRKGEGMVEDIRELAGLARTKPAFAFALAMLMFSLAGIPPLAGFFAKFYVFIAAVDAGLAPLAVLAVVTSVVGAYYYLRIVKLIYFDEPKAAFANEAMSAEMWGVLGASAAFTLLFFVYPSPLLTWAGHAAASLF